MGVVAGARSVTPIHIAYYEWTPKWLHLDVVSCGAAYAVPRLCGFHLTS